MSPRRLGPCHTLGWHRNSIVQLGRSVGVSVVAEGIERLDQIPVLVEASIGSGQGYVLARPMPAEAVTPLVASGLRLASASPSSGHHA